MWRKWPTKAKCLRLTKLVMWPCRGVGSVHTLPHSWCLGETSWPGTWRAEQSHSFAHGKVHFVLICAFPRAPQSASSSSPGMKQLAHPAECRGQPKGAGRGEKEQEEEGRQCPGWQRGKGRAEVQGPCGSHPSPQGPAEGSSLPRASAPTPSPDSWAD